ncbi:hypothetical protein NYZ02_05410 [Acinetobacter baumannii]|nr:hypothetical protein [Acinetobacter baumannii]
MKPEQFIREYGVDKAREVLEIVPENEHYFTNVMIKPCGNWVYSQIARLTHHDGVKFNVSFKLLEEWKPKFVNLKDLKRLVKSVEIINQAGGYEVVKTAISNYRASGDMVTFSSLEKRLKDHESIYGGGDD